MARTTFRFATLPILGPHQDLLEVDGHRSILHKDDRLDVVVLLVRADQHPDEDVDLLGDLECISVDRAE